jgi:hypothetical protein
LENVPPWEWVDGDPVLARRFRWATVANSAVSVGSLTLLVLGTYRLLAYSPTWSFVFSVIFLLSAVGLSLLAHVPRWFPVVGRLGISPVGVRFEYGFRLRPLTWSWTEVKEVGPEWVTVSSNRILRYRFRLTTNQAQRVSHFLKPWNGRLPLPS